MLLFHGLAIMPGAKTFNAVFDVEFHEVVLLLVSKVRALEFKVDVVVNGLIPSCILLLNNLLRCNHQPFLLLLFRLLDILIFPAAHTEAFPFHCFAYFCTFKRFLSFAHITHFVYIFINPPAHLVI